MSNFVEFFAGNLFQSLSRCGEFFVNLDYLFGHDLMRLLGAPHQHKILARRQAFMTIGIQSNTENYPFASCFLFSRMCHCPQTNAFAQQRQI